MRWCGRDDGSRSRERGQAAQQGREGGKQAELPVLARVTASWAVRKEGRLFMEAALRATAVCSYWHLLPRAGRSTLWEGTLPGGTRSSPPGRHQEPARSAQGQTLLGGLFAGFTDKEVPFQEHVISGNSFILLREESQSGAGMPELLGTLVFA